MRFDNKTQLAGDKEDGQQKDIRRDIFDRMTGGLHCGDLILLAGRPGSGKTTLAIDITVRSAFLFHVPVYYFSMEMTKEQIYRCLVGSKAGINMEDKLLNAPIYVDDAPGITASGMLNRARRFKKDKGIGLIVVDYLQLMAREAETLGQSLLETASSLKSMALELNIPVIALSQLARSEGECPDRRPVLADLRPRALEEKADIVCLLYRKGLVKTDRAESIRGNGEVIIAKNRNGPAGSFFID